jgi:hypothetical protein
MPGPVLPQYGFNPIADQAVAEQRQQLLNMAHVVS